MTAPQLTREQSLVAQIAERHFQAIRRAVLDPVPLAGLAGLADYLSQAPEWLSDGEAAAVGERLMDAARASGKQPATPAEPTTEQAIATDIIGELVRDADLVPLLPVQADGLTEGELNQLCRDIVDLIRSATVSVTWPQDADQAGGDQ